MREGEVTKFLVSFNGNIEYVRFPAGVFDENLYLQYDVVWGPDWDPLSGLNSGTSQMARSGNDPEKVIFNMPLEITFSSTNVYGWPQIVVSVRARNFISSDSLRGYALFHLPAVTGTQELVAHLVRPRSASLVGEWVAWLTGRYPELIDPKILASGKENYLLKTESYGTVVMRVTMVSKDLRKLGYDNQPS
ncbi:unnamed protein product [Danaus chrysippus]|uniref:B9 domain-containing protein 1 n=1 Tax=Danaus chrysippus TaxID=151541 RepID=A0A8J2W733_9NEOP|nr:unnamed protein product [Danaus chrysippus]